MNHELSAQTRVSICGTFEFRDKDGNVVKTLPFTGEVPVEQTTTNDEQEQPHGDVCK